MRTIGIIAWILTGNATAGTVAFPQPPVNSGAYEYISGLLCYMSGGLDPKATPHAECLQKASVSIAVDALPKNLDDALKALATQEAKPQDILDWWDEAQPLTIAERGQNTLITDTLAGFRSQTQFEGWPRQIIPLSVVKKKTRVIYRSPDGMVPAVSVAVTHDSQTGDVTTPVRETEVAVERGDGNADFYSYDHLGKRSQFSVFTAGPRPVPSSCLGCHFHKDTRTFPRDGF